MGRRVSSAATLPNCELDIWLDYLLGLAAYNRISCLSRRHNYPGIVHSQLF